MATTRRRSLTSSPTGYVLALPYLLLLIAFGVIPTVYAVYLSFAHSRTGAFVGVENFVRAFGDYRFLPALINVAAYLVIWLPFMTVMVLLIAFILQSSRDRLSGVFRLVYYLPGAFTGSASVLIWIFVLDPEIGPFSWFIPGEYITDVVGDDRLPVIFALMAFTAGAGGWIVIMYGALNGVSSEVIEAARMDGANAVQLAWSIRLPLIAKYVVYMLILSFSGGLQLFAEPLILNQILTVGTSTWSLNQLAVMTGIQEGQVGTSSALALSMLIVGVIAALVLIFRTDFFDTKELGK